MTVLSRRCLAREIPRYVRRVLLCASLCASLTRAVHAQSRPGSALPDFTRFLQLTGDLPVEGLTAGRRTSIVDDSLARGRPGAQWRAGLTERMVEDHRSRRDRFSVIAPELRVFQNSARPWGVNDGAVWQGRGLTASFAAGVRLRAGIVTLTVDPLGARAQNSTFTLSPLAVRAGHSEFAYPTQQSFTIDWPQRFGAESYDVADWGQTGIRAVYRGAEAGFTHESQWWGPGVRNSILMTDNAPGFWHAYLGTSRPMRTQVGGFSARWIWGSLRESGFFDSIPTNDRRFATGLVVAYEPRWAPGLELGGARVFQQAWGAGPDARDLLLMLKPFQKKAQYTAGNPSGEDEQDQMASIFARWVLPASRLELYGEWGKGDHSEHFRDLMLQPEHGSGWLIGLQKAMGRSPTSQWRLMSELLLLGAPRTTATRSPDAGFFYVHGLIPQGYTHRGQVMGAGAGPGSSQFITKVDRFSRWGRAGVGVMRTVYDNDRFYKVNASPDRRTHEVEPTLMADLVVVRGAWDLGAALNASNLLNKHYLRSNDEWNVNLVFSAAWHPAARRREATAR